jgi:hypothetical protein
MKLHGIALVLALSLCSCAAIKPTCAVIDVAHQACEYVTVTYLAPDGTVKTERVPVAELATSAERARLARLAASK